MAQILVRNLDPEVIERLRAQAKRNDRSLEAEVRQILMESAPDPAAREELLKFAREMQEKTRGKVVGDSTDIIRELRDSR